MANYSLSSSATNDLVGIYKFGVKRFGNEPAKKYLFSLENFMHELANKPDLARDASMFAHGLKYYNYKAHVLFYIIDSSSSIHVLRILGSRMNFIEHL